jgi:hypothetical protein
MPGRRRHNGWKRISKAATPKQELEPGAEVAAGNLLAFTVDATTGNIISVETLDASGERHKLSIRQQRSFAREGRERLESVLEEAFEAGIDCVLGDSDQPEAAESEVDAKLRHDLIAPLIQGSPAGRRLKREFLQRAVLGTLIQSSIDSGPPSRSH